METKNSKQAITITREYGPMLTGSTLLLTGAWIATPLGVFCMVIGSITLGTSLWVHLFSTTSKKRI